MLHLLDADWAIEALANRSPAVDVLRQIGPSELAISWVTVGEIFEGAFGTPDPSARLATFRAFLQPIQRIGVDDAVMTRFAELRAMLRRQGHLGRIPGLQIYQPPATR